MAEAMAIAAPRTEEIIKSGVGMGMGMVTGLAQGTVAKFAPQFGAIAPILTWGSLLITPLIGAAGALLTRGTLSDALMGVAAGSSAVLGYSVPALLPEFGRRGLTAEQRAALAAGRDIKQLPPGPAGALQRQQQAAARAVGIDF
ncbi:hypothetical protein ES703_16680 [subsurface metagenome]